MKRTPAHRIRDVNLIEKVRLLAHILRWRLTWDRRDTASLPPEPLTDKFRSARAAADMIPDGACVISCGISGNARCSILYWAVRERFEQSGYPQGLTWISVGGQGGRGRAPGTVEEVGLDGLVTRYIAGHTETAKSLLRLADAGRLELHTLPQGEMIQVIEAQGRGEQSVRSRTGIGSFLDPRVGRGSPVTPNASKQFVHVDGDELAYSMLLYLAHRTQIATATFIFTMRRPLPKTLKRPALRGKTVGSCWWQSLA